MFQLKEYFYPPQRSKHSRSRVDQAAEEAAFYDNSWAGNPPGNSAGVF